MPRSLTTLTPILADARMVDAYDFLSSAGALLRVTTGPNGTGGELQSVCSLLAARSLDQLEAPRLALARLREQLNLEARGLIGRMVKEGAAARAANATRVEVPRPSRGEIVPGLSWLG